MFLIFGLGRLNVLPVGDIGVRAAVCASTMPWRSCRRYQLRERAEAWLPSCTSRHLVFVAQPGLDAAVKSFVRNGLGLMRTARGLAYRLLTEPRDPDLARVVDAWPNLTAPIRRAILAIIESAE